MADLNFFDVIRLPQPRVGPPVLSWRLEHASRASTGQSSFMYATHSSCEGQFVSGIDEML
jgi:hypothetical protein